jgi:hypothetical protein
MRRKLNPWLAAVMEAYDAAMEVWERDAEDASYGYKTEVGLFEHDHPKPQLREFLRTMSAAEAKHAATH